MVPILRGFALKLYRKVLGVPRQQPKSTPKRRRLLFEPQKLGQGAYFQNSRGKRQGHVRSILKLGLSYV